MKADAFSQARFFLNDNNVQKVVVLVDANVDALYPNYFNQLLDGLNVCKIVVPAGEKSKSIEQSIQIWQKLIDFQADRHTLLLNFGGGMVCDLGGFIASTYKRGIQLANCPTTLLSMIDAAIGGKNGINFSRIKNCIGTFRPPDYLFPADLDLLKTLPETELQSGFGEMVKYALIGNKQMFNELESISVLNTESIKPEWITFCVDFKNDIVKQDPYDRDVRHVLNFGHTVGHAVESLFAEAGHPIPHGVAVAIGMMYESRLSHHLGKLSSIDLSRIEQLIGKHFPVPSFTDQECEKLQTFMLQDKKNADGKVNFNFLFEIGKIEMIPTGIDIVNL